MQSPTRPLDWGQMGIKKELLENHQLGPKKGTLKRTGKIKEEKRQLVGLIEGSYCKIRKVRTSQKLLLYPQFWTMNTPFKRYRQNGKRCRHIVNPNSSSLIWVYTVCLDLPVQRLWFTMVLYFIEERCWVKKGSWLNTFKILVFIVFHIFWTAICFTYFIFITYSSIILAEIIYFLISR